MIRDASNSCAQSDIGPAHSVWVAALPTDACLSVRRGQSSTQVVTSDAHAVRDFLIPHFDMRVTRFGWRWWEAAAGGVRPGSGVPVSPVQAGLAYEPLSIACFGSVAVR